MIAQTLKAKQQLKQLSAPCAKITTSTATNMETFLEQLDALIAEQDLSVIEVVGALQYAQQQLVIESYIGSDDDEEETDAEA